MQSAFACAVELKVDVLQVFKHVSWHYATCYKWFVLKINTNMATLMSINSVTAESALRQIQTYDQVRD